MPDLRRPSDAAQRQRALDTSESFIVQAPAGSGKTELLIQRILALLSQVETPEEILSITFTRKAAAEMRTRLLRALDRAADETPPEAGHALTTWQLARKARERDHRLDWKLLHNPNRLQLVTIDSFCAHLVRRMPWLSRYGAPPAINPEPRDDYRQAAERLLTEGVEGKLVHKQVHTLLRHLDNRLDRLRDMLVEMLAKRDQWLRYLLDQRHAESRNVLEGCLGQVIDHQLQALVSLLPDTASSELVELARFAADNQLQVEASASLETLANLDSLPKAEKVALPVWLELVDLLLTQGGSVRSRVTKAQGFPAGKDPHCQQMKQRMQQLLDLFRDDENLLAALQGVRKLPRATYHDSQWLVLDALVDLLPLAAAELDKVFREQGRVDFVAIAGGANRALGPSDSPEELLLQLDSRINHILVDEFQDTSFVQFSLLQRLIAGWEKGDGRTLFLVGDPMQSIYRFREAEVGLFIRVWQRGIENILPEPLTLTTNFRSGARIVHWVNDVFEQVFPRREDEGLGAVVYAPAEAASHSQRGETVTLRFFAGQDDHQESGLIVEQIKSRMKEDPDQTHAILVRSRAHAQRVVADLRAAQIRFQAQDLEPLNQRQAILDVLALTRALLHPGDRVSWLAVLRAPWCGLSLESLLILCEGDRHATIWSLLQDPQRLNWLHPEERQRLERLVDVFGQSLQRTGREPLERVVYATWLGLGGPAVYTTADGENVQQFLRLLATVQNAGDLIRFEILEDALASLYAASDATNARVQVMTIHKAKGLEFDHVYLPGLGRTVRGLDRQLLRWVEHPVFGLLLAPIPSTGEKGEDVTYAAIGSLLSDKDAYESARLLYVACTRARTSLTLTGHVKEVDGVAEPPANSLLHLAWEELSADSITFVKSEEGCDEKGGMPGQELIQLPAGWKFPPLSVPSFRQGPTPRQASHIMDEMGATSLHGNTARIIGTVVHAWLEKIACQGLDTWDMVKVVNQRKRLAGALISHGYPGHEANKGAEAVIEHLKNILEGDSGRWLLTEHNSAENEVALSGILEGDLVEAVVDRTFIAEDGRRWVIDYKTGSPREGESVDDYIVHETKRYRQQVETYVALYQALDSGQPILGALYFTAHDRLEVVVENRL